MKLVQENQTFRTKKSVNWQNRMAQFCTKPNTWSGLHCRIIVWVDNFWKVNGSVATNTSKLKNMKSIIRHQRWLSTGSHGDTGGRKRKDSAAEAGAQNNTNQRWRWRRAPVRYLLIGDETAEVFEGVASGVVRGAGLIGGRDWDTATLKRRQH